MDVRKMKIKRNIAVFLYACIMALIANSYLWLNKNRMIVFLVLFVLINVLAGTFIIKTKSLRTWTCWHGAVLLTVFMPVALFSFGLHAVLIFILDWDIFLPSSLYSTVVNALLFFNGMGCIYLASYQLGVAKRIKALLCGLIPVLNLIVLQKMVRTVYGEVYTECAREQRNAARVDEKLCRTKYPIVLVHGVCFRDFKYFNYWGRIPKDLRQNGAMIYHGNQQAIASVADNAQELTDRIKEICRTTGCEKVNIIAHSKGGLDSRYAIDRCGLGQYVASLTTICTPHKGCMYADYLFDVVSEDFKLKLGHRYNAVMRYLGDHKPDLLAALRDLTYEACEEFNKTSKEPEGIFCQSYGSVLKKASNKKFPLSWSYLFVKHFEGPNDGIVCETSFQWGQRFTMVEGGGDIGISHGDICDMMRIDVEDFDVREFYVELVNDLKNRGF